MRRMKFFDRTEERERLCNLLSQEPNTIFLMMGPVSCGKSRLVEDIVEDLLRGDGKHQGSGALYINLRRKDSKTPALFASALARKGVAPLINGLPADRQQSIDATAAAFHSTFKVEQDMDMKRFSKVTATLWDAIKAQQEQDKKQHCQQEDPLSKSSSITQVIEMYEKILQQWEWARQAKELTQVKHQWPVVVTDEVDKFCQWTDEHHADRQTLLEYFVKATKAKNTCHVLLVTADYTF
ncbi:hypothetical protein JKP88DRAFT_323638 [Tribonema minus]|uniref:ATPase domain-containing protein n=1 Tax=Tribonema minus TaxID=303371 RepID=A0A835YTV4_9STRA|nr:hypothetical protein JKP88DRAFT_323638 [Tribonema minus]